MTNDPDEYLDYDPLPYEHRIREHYAALGYCLAVGRICMTFGEAIEAMERGVSVSRNEWSSPSNGPSKWVRLHNSANSLLSPYFVVASAREPEPPIDGRTGFVPADYNHEIWPIPANSVWTPSHSDMLAKDWFVLK